MIFSLKGEIVTHDSPPLIKRIDSVKFILLLLFFIPDSPLCNVIVSAWCFLRIRDHYTLQQINMADEGRTTLPSDEFLRVYRELPDIQTVTHTAHITSQGHGKTHSISHTLTGWSRWLLAHSPACYYWPPYHAVP